MKYRTLGRTGLNVSRVCLGTMTFGQEGWGCDEATAGSIVSTFLDAGGNFIDTADVYSAGRSEEFLGRALQSKPRHQVVLATKCFFARGPSPNERGLSRKHILRSCEESLRRLQTDYIDLYQIHGPDPVTPIEETLRALDDLVRDGKVRYLGVSNLYAWQIVKANLTAERLGLERFCSAQHLYNLISRDVEREVLPACRDQGVGMICWSPLAGGFLSGKYQDTPMPPEGTRIAQRAAAEVPRFWHERGKRLAQGVLELAQAGGCKPEELALGWLLAQAGVTSVIVGTRSVEQLESNLVVGERDLSRETLAELDRLAIHDLGYPHSWIALNGAAQFQDIERV
jgi:aryl-alcohol dehydrogenase-like predicted oxidoreductase